MLSNVQISMSVLIIMEAVLKCALIVMGRSLVAVILISSWIPIEELALVKIPHPINLVITSFRILDLITSSSSQFKIINFDNVSLLST